MNYTELNILYEDNHIIVVNKPYGILSQEDHTKEQDMLSLIKEYIKIKANKPGNVWLGLVHRLDRNTSGIMVFAKTSKAASRLSASITNNEFHKSYYAVVEGITNDYEELKDYVYKDERLVKSFVTTKEKGKLAILEYKTIKHIDNTSLIEVNLKTGRHHQIRVQMANINHPLVGDKLYNSTIDTNYLLHAYKLSFLILLQKKY